MKKILMLAVVMICCLTGCTYDIREAQNYNSNSFNNPIYIGKINGQKLFCIKIAHKDMFQSANYEHYVYFFENNPVISVNHQIPEGDDTRTMIEVFLNGKPILSTNLIEDPYAKW